MNKQDKKTIESAIAHLNGYASIIQSRTNYIPVAVDDCIKELKIFLANKDKCNKRKSSFTKGRQGTKEKKR